MLHKYKLTPHSLTSLVIVVLLLIGIPVYIWIHNSNSSSSVNTKTNLLFSDATKGQLYITDNTGKQLAKYPYPVNSYLGYQASQTNGTLLVSLNANTPNETFMLLKNASPKELPAPVVASLHSTSLIGLTHSLFFNSDNSVLGVICPDGASCVLDSINLTSGSKTLIIDTGLKQANVAFAQAFLVAYSDSDHTAYLRLDGTNKLSKSVSALYKIDTNSKKVTASFSLPQSIGYALSVSPDYSQLVYSTVDAKANTTLHILDLSTSKEQKVALSLGNPGSMPGAFKWSQDSKKILLQAQKLPGTSNASAALPTSSAYVDLGDKNKVVNLQQISDSKFGLLFYHDWLDNGNVIYQTKKTTTAYSFYNATVQTTKQDISSKTVSNFAGPVGDLDQAFQVTK